MKSHLLEQIYLASPKWAQNILVSIYGLLEHNRRYGGSHSKFKNNLKVNEQSTHEELMKLVQTRLDKILHTATTSVPYYENLSLSQVKLSEFPLLDRQKVADNTELFLNRKYSKNKLIALHTGGSTANPLKVYISKSIRQKSYAFWSQFYERFNFHIGNKKASFVGRKIQNPDDNRPPFWRYNVIDKQVIFSSYHLSEKNLPIYIKKLNKFKPEIIEGYPQTIHRLAEYIIRNNLTLEFKPKGISTSSENFTRAQRAEIEEAFNSKVYDQYGSAESVVFAAECNYGTMHIEPEYGVVEVLDTNGEIHQDGEGELIVTTLLNDVMPLIRYRIGDLGRISYKSCQCGRHTATLDELQGKVGAVIISGDKRIPAAAIAIAFEYLEGVKNAQIIQDKADEVIVKLVKKSDFNPKSESFMIWELKKMLGESLSIKVDYVPSIPPENNGKYKMVVQNYFEP